MNRSIEAGDHHAVWREFGEQPVALFALAQRFLSMLALGDVSHRAGDPRWYSTFVVKRLTLVEDVNVRAVGAAEFVFVRPVRVAAPHELFKFEPDAIQVFGMNAFVPVLQSGRQFSGAVTE